MPRSPLSARAFFRDPVGYVDAESGGDGVVRFAAGTSPYVVVRDPDAVWQVLVAGGTDYAPGKWKRRARRFVGPTLNTLHGSEHAERRRLVQPALGRPRVDAFEEAIAARAERFAGALHDGESFVLRERLDAVSVAMAGDVLLSTDLGDRAAPLATDLATIMAAVPRLAPPAARRSRARALARVHEVIDAVVAERGRGGVPSGGGAPARGETPSGRGAPARGETPSGGDLVDALLAADLPPATVRGELTAFLLAAADEPPSGLESAFWLLGRHPEAVERLGEADFLDAVLRETLRLFPPARHIDRCPAHAVELAGERVRAGTNVVVSPVVVHRDERLHERAADFVPERWLRAMPGRRPAGRTCRSAPACTRASASRSPARS